MYCVLYYIYVGKVYALVRNRPAAVSYGISKIKRKLVTLLDRPRNKCANVKVTMNMQQKFKRSLFDCGGESHTFDCQLRTGVDNG